MDEPAVALAASANGRWGLAHHELAADIRSRARMFEIHVPASTTRLLRFRAIHRMFHCDAVS